MVENGVTLYILGWQISLNLLSKNKLQNNAYGAVPYVGEGGAHRKLYIPILHIYMWKLH